MTDDGPASRTVSEEHTLKGMRKTIASRLKESYREAVHVTASREVDAGALLAAAEAADVSVTDVLLCAISETLAAHPAFNATFEDGTHRVYEEHNVAVAVAVEAGLVTPVIADVGSKSLAEVAAERRRLTEAVRAGEHSMTDLRGSTLTLSNLGPLGVDSFSPIINPPEVAILGVGQIVDRARPEGDGVAVRKVLTVDLSFDHRVVDGADAARFLETLAGGIESAKKYVES